MKRKTLRTEKLDEAREKRLKEDLSPREENFWGKLINTWEKDLSYVCHQLADGCKECKTEISLAHYEDETDRTCWHITYNLFASHFYCMIRCVLFPGDYLSQLLERTTKLLK